MLSAAYTLCMSFCFFFFSSRRRHTRCLSDWSSDVCSSDLYFRKADVIETSRGCLHLCNFCSIREMYGTSFRMFPIDRVLADIEDAYSRGARHIFCTDDNITLDMER